MLDRLVNAERLLSNPASDALQGAAVSFPEIEPWSEPVNGAQVLDEIAARFARYVWFPDGAAAADVSALWAAYTHCYKAFDCAPLLNYSSPEKRSGKTITLEVLGLFVPRPLSVDSVSTAALFRVTAKYHPTLLADECDAWLPDNEELRGLFNSGYRRNKKYMRCVGDDQEPRLFDCFTPKALSGIGLLPGTMLDRSIQIRLERAKRDEIKTRFDSRHVEKETELCRKLTRWIADNRARIESIEPKLPQCMFGRVADNWRPLFAIAQVAGDKWQKRCADAYYKLQGREFEDVETLRVMLLTDVQQIFAGTWPPLDEKQKPVSEERLFSKDLCEQLAEMKERPWPEVRKGKPITERWLARNLAAFGIRPKLLRIGEDAPARGYEKADFEDAFTRYVGTPSFQVLHRHDTRENEQNSSVTKEETCNGAKSDPYTAECNGVTDKKGDTSENTDPGERNVEAVSADVDASLPDKQSTWKEKLRL
jgi:hypothetical protein